MKEVNCLDCLQLQRVEYLVADVGGVLPHFCSYCGSQNITLSNVENEYWYAMAHNLGMKRTAKNAELINLLYKDWCEEPNPTRKFGSYVLQRLKEAKSVRK